MASLQDNKNLTYILYGLYIAAIFSAGILAIVAVVINYVKLQDVKGTILESHFQWQIRSFWWYLLWNVIAIASFFLILLMYKSAWWGVIAPTLCFGIMGIAWIWSIYRAIRGLITLSEDRPIST